ncbi:MAG TPA: anti-sigma regulatory factor [Polyangiaceae bacterium]|nr:anti-sigma regulatory factor [Polyangiaceae bacterium]
MSTTVLERYDMRIDTEDDIILVRRKVRDIAQSCRFDVFAASAVTTAASELARNVWTHAGRGVARIEKVTDDMRMGVRADFEDQGPGIADVTRALAGGYSTANSMGLGLSGSRRLVDEFSIESTPGRGTRVTFVKWAPF